MKNKLFLSLLLCSFSAISQTKTQVLTDINTKIPSNKPALQSDLRKVLTDITNLTPDANKVDKVSGKQLSTEDYTTADKSKINGLQSSLDSFMPKLNPNVLGSIGFPVQNSVPTPPTTGVKLFSDVNGVPTFIDSYNNINTIKTDRFDLFRLKRLITNIVNGATTQIRWLTFGDSMGQSKTKHIFNNLDDFVGYSGGFNGGNYGGTTTNTGSVTTTVQDYSVFPFSFIQIAQGNSHVIGLSGVTAMIDRIKLYLLNNGATYSIQINDINVSGHTAITLPNNNGVTIISLSPTLAPNKVALLAITGNVRELSNGLWNSTTNGLIPVNLSEGGNDMSSWIGNAQALSNLTTIIGDVNPDVISYEMKENVLGFETRFETLMTSLQTNAYNSEIILFTTTPTQLTDNEQVLNNNEIKKQAKKRRLPIYDTYSFAGSYQRLLDNYWTGDGIHPSDVFQQLAANDFIKEFRLMDIANATGRVVSSNQNIATKFTSGNVYGMNRMELYNEPTIGYDGIIRAYRGIQFQNLSATKTFQLDLGDGTNGSDGSQTVLPFVVRLGSANTRIRGDGANIYVMDATTSGNTSTALGGLVAKSIQYETQYTSGFSPSTILSNGYKSMQLFNGTGNYIFGDSNLGGEFVDTPSAKVHIRSTTKGILIPRMTTTQRDAIASPAEGLEIYNLTVHAKEFFNGTSWKTITTN